MSSVEIRGEHSSWEQEQEKPAYEASARGRDPRAAAIYQTSTRSWERPNENSLLTRSLSRRVEIRGRRRRYIKRALVPGNKNNLGTRSLSRRVEIQRRRRRRYTKEALISGGSKAEHRGVLMLELECWRGRSSKEEFRRASLPRGLHEGVEL